MPRFTNFCCPDNKALRGVSDVAKRIARNQSQRRVVAGFQNLSLIGLDDSRRLHLIFKFSLRAFDIDFISLPYPLQFAEESIALTRQHQVSSLAWAGRAFQVSYTPRQRVIAGSLEYHRR